MHNRLGVRLLHASDADRGWDVFSLDYSLAGSPCAAVFSEHAMGRYLRAFNLLWRLKRVEQCLAHTWTRQMTHAGKLARLSRAAPGCCGLGALLRKGHLLRHDMNHFATNLASYIMFEVGHPPSHQRIDIAPRFLTANPALLCGVLARVH